jgi:hypothetical protein
MSAGPDRPTLRTISRRHKTATVATIAIVVVFVGVMAAAALPSARAGALKDSSTCSAWTAASQAQQTAYAHLYITEHGSNVSGALGAASVVSAVNSACNHAAYLGEADDISVVGALNHAF